MAGDMQATINIVTWVFFGLSAGAVFLRFVAHFKRGDAPLVDDWIMLFSVAFYLAVGVISSIAISYGTGKHESDVDPAQIPNILYWLLLAGYVGFMGCSFPRIAVAILMNRVLIPGRFVRYFSLSIVFMFFVFTMINLILGYVQCHPVSYRWNPDQPGYCTNTKAAPTFAVFASSFGAFVDLFFSVYPPIRVAQLNMALRKKIVAMAILGLGLLSFIVTVYKTADTLAPALNVLGKTDFTYIGGFIVLWTNIELSVAIIAGSIPTWGWLLRTQAYNRLITWTTALSLSRRSPNSSRRQPNDGDDQERESDGPSEDIAMKPRRKRSAQALATEDSVLALERAVHS